MAAPNQPPGPIPNLPDKTTKQARTHFIASTLFFLTGAMWLFNAMRYHHKQSYWMSAVWLVLGVLWLVIGVKMNRQARAQQLTKNKE